jgi:selenide,water dikinase
MVGLERADDAGVYRVSDDLALIQTVDFFTPIVDDPFWFGQIAAANALSDIYAMGGEPKTAMNLVGFPLKEMDLSILRKILEGGIAKMKEAGVVLIGGHSVEDAELKYGLSVTGFVHPDRVLTKGGLRPGDRLILTKPLGTGVINTAIKADMASLDVIESVTHLMAELNRDAARAMAAFPVHACTDITGFGLLGHLAEMVIGSGCGLVLRWTDIPVMPAAVEYAGYGLLPAGAFKNKEFRQHMVEREPGVDALMVDLLFDPQTSGGLLIAVAEEHAASLLERLIENGVQHSRMIGEVKADSREKIRII